MCDTRESEIRIGGAVRRGLLQDLIRLIDNAGLEPDWSCPCDSARSEAELLQCRDENGLLRLCSEEELYGVYVELEAFLLKEKIGFDLRHAPCDEYNGELRRYRPGFEEVVVSDADAGGEPFVLVSDLKEVRGMLERCRTADHIRQVIERVNELCFSEDVPPLEPFRVIG